MKFLCWDSDNDTREDAIVMDAETPKEAAELFAERDHDEEPFDSINVLVEGLMDGNRIVIRVDVDWSPNFTAMPTPR